MTNAESLIKYFGLRPLQIEGGYFRQSYISEETIARSALPGRYITDKNLSVAIYYLLTNDPDSFSALHSLPTDEIWHFYLGDPVEILLLYPDGTSGKVILGQDVLHGQHVQFVVPKGVWQGSYLLPGGEFAFMGTTMAPGFDEHDYTGGERAVLIQRYPGESALIEKLTRPERPLDMKKI